MLRVRRPASTAARRLMPAVLALSIPLGGCTGQTDSPSERGRPDTSAGASAVASESSRGSTFTDGRAEINPTPLEVTQRRMRIVARALEEVRQSTGRYPADVRAILDLPIADPNLRPKERWLIDGWNRPLRYVLQSSGYELRSAGEDGRFQSGDDVVQAGSA